MGRGPAGDSKPDGSVHPEYQAMKLAIRLSSLSRAPSHGRGDIMEGSHAFPSPCRPRRAQRGTSGSARPDRSGALHQSRAELAGVQPAGSGSGQRSRAPAARAREVPEHRRQQSRRVLHGARGDAAQEVSRRHRRLLARRAAHRAAAASPSGSARLRCSTTWPPAGRSCCARSSRPRGSACSSLPTTRRTHGRFWPSTSRRISGRF